MISAEGLIRYCEGMYNAQPVYCWGADGEVITKEFLDKLKKTYGASHYTKIDLAKHEGKIGADCSGLLTAVSGMNTTAANYYSKCLVKGRAAAIPHKVCLIFREENGKIVHVGVYDGKKYSYEMWNSCDKKEFNPSKWTYYGIPSWLEEQKEIVEELTVGDKIEIKGTLKGYNSADRAIKGGSDYASILNSGVYYVYKIYNGSVNLSKTKGVPGSWVVL